MFIYLRMITDNDTKKQIETTAEAYQYFFFGDINNSEGIVIDAEDEKKNKASFRISKGAGASNSYRFSSYNNGITLSNFLNNINGEKYKSGDIIKIIRKNETFQIYLITENSKEYESLKSLLINRENTSVIIDSPSNQTPTQIIFYGVPGSGKSHSIKNELVKKGITDLKEQTKRVVFHPEYTNADFVGQILPQSSDGGKSISYPFVPGPFTQILAKAYTHKETQYALIIEEINRGNAAAIFGELFQLLDRLDEDETESSNEKSYEKGWSSYPINNDNINKAIQEAYEKFKTDSKFKPFIDKEKFDTYKLNIGIRLPPNLSIFATMNTSDQNVFKLDNAFKRRWELRLIPNKFNNEPKEINQRDAVVDGFDFTWNNFRESVNSIIIDPDNSIDISSFADRQIGCWFTKAIKKDEKYIIEKEVFVHKVLEYLWDDVCNGDIGIFFNEKYKSFAELVEDVSEKGITDIFSENLKVKLQENITTTKAKIRSENTDLDLCDFEINTKLFTKDKSTYCEYKGNKKVLLAGEDDSENNYVSLREATEKISPQNKETCYEYWFVDEKSIRNIFLEKNQENKPE